MAVIFGKRKAIFIDVKPLYILNPFATHSRFPVLKILGKNKSLPLRLFSSVKRQKKPVERHLYGCNSLVFSISDLTAYIRRHSHDARPIPKIATHESH